MWHQFPVARELAPAGLRSRPLFWAASRPSGSKLPRHKGCVKTAVVAAHSVKDALGRRQPYNARRFLG
ncbi:hypothetical protein F7R05_02075 [Pseudomonas koreensis]|nr:hypothetical protein F7R05_02075 [Pseudomonas koreensis]